MAIDIKNFVDINIKPLERVGESGSRPEVLVVGAPSEFTESGYIRSCNSDYTKFYSDVLQTVEIKDEMSEEYKSYAKIFFANGGIALRFTGKKYEEITDVKARKDYINNVIIVDYNKDPKERLSGETESNSEDDTQENIYQKILIRRDGYEEGKPIEAQEIDPKHPFTAVKISRTIGAEMTIAAYLSKMQVYEAGSVADYDFTQEYELKEDLSGGLDYESEKSLEKIPFNYEMQIGGRYLNIGGNTLDGESLVEKYVTIILTQTVTEKVFNVLSAKLKGQSGIATIRTAIAAELNKYVGSGFLVTNKVWTSPDLVVANGVRSGETEVVIRKNTPLSAGYYIHMFKLDETGRKAYAFIILPTAKGIRYVKIDGRTM